jgi:uncharacterized protein (DUF302 family)
MMLLAIIVNNKHFRRKIKMKKIQLILISAGTFVTGIVITMVIMWNAAPSIMMIEDQSPYSFEETTAKFEATVKAKGWKIPTVHNLQQTMDKYGYSVREVKVYELCHPEHAEKILSNSNERIVSSMMPCRVAIYVKEDGKTYISRMNTGLMGSMMDGVVPEVMDIASAESEEMITATLKN